ncbi:MAG: Gx transporter family protein [Dorea formicigenerans]
MTRSQKISYCAVFTALAMIFSYVEAILPINFGVPGMKLGLANLVIVAGLYYLNEKDVLIISVTRILLMGLLFGNGMSLIYSLTGGMISYLIMILMKKKTNLSVLVISIGGGITHNIGQLIAASLVVSNFHIFYYFPALLIAGTITGLLIGIVSERILKILKPNFFD